METMIGSVVVAAFGISGWALLKVHTLAVKVAVLEERDMGAARIVEQIRADMKTMEDRLTARIDRLAAAINGKKGP